MFIIVHSQIINLNKGLNYFFWCNTHFFPGSLTAFHLFLLDLAFSSYFPVKDLFSSSIVCLSQSLNVR